MKQDQYKNMPPELFAGGPIALFKWVNAEGWPVEFVTPNVDEVFGYADTEFLSGDVSYSSIIHPNDLDRVVDEVISASEQGVSKFKHEDYRVIRKDGSITWLEDHTKIIRNDDNKITHYFGYVLDITDRKHIESLLNKSLKRFDLAMQGANDGLYDWDLISDEVYYSPRWKSMLGYENTELPNTFSVWESLVHPDDLDKSWKMLSAFLEGKRDNFNIEFRMLHKDGHWVDILSRATMEFSGDGTPIRVVGTHVDISDNRQVEVQLRQAKEEAESANQAKSEFLAAMSHDLRTPLNAIMGFSDMMRQKAFGPLGNEHYDEYADDIHSSGSLLVSLINDVLDLSKIEAGKYELADETLSLTSIIEVSIRQSAPLADISNLTLSSDISSDLPHLVGDERALTQILNNLVSNAIKFTPSGGKVFLSATLQQDNSIIITIRDSGIGMSEEGIATALRPFEQIDGSKSRKHEGTGLGLHLCVNLMELFGGSIRFESEEDRGTTVTLQFPSERTINPS
jgi:two-component system, sensor histidine kinase and response regulator